MITTARKWYPRLVPLRCPSPVNLLVYKGINHFPVWIGPIYADIVPYTSPTKLAYFVDAIIKSLADAVWLEMLGAAGKPCGCYDRKPGLTFS